jgi:hypothetical protein
MVKRISRIAPLQAGFVYALFMGVISIFAVPIIFLVSVLAPKQPGANGAFAAMGLVMILIIPIMYIFIGFIMGAIAALIYNLIAKFTGGIEMTLSDVTPQTLMQ